jgi:hypothetical protein
MDEIGPRREERLRELARNFVSVFGNGEDADLAATMLVMALAWPIIEADRPRYLAALERLPKGSAAKPRVSHVSPYNGGDAQRWCVTFADDHAKYQSSRHFLTKAEADDYASDFHETPRAPRRVVNARVTLWAGALRVSPLSATVGAEVGPPRHECSLIAIPPAP